MDAFESAVLATVASGSETAHEIRGALASKGDCTIGDDELLVTLTHLANSGLIEPFVFSEPLGIRIQVRLGIGPLSAYSFFVTPLGRVEYERLAA